MHPYLVISPRAGCELASAWKSIMADLWIGNIETGTSDQGSRSS
jgi:hypothetical protein